MWNYTLNTHETTFSQSVFMYIGIVVQALILMCVMLWSCFVGLTEFHLSIEVFYEIHDIGRRHS